MDVCIVCAKELDETYLVNKYGDAFCSEACYDEFYNSPAAEGLTPDGDNAFYDEYRILRDAYIDWLSSWRSDLENERDDPAYAACEMFEHLDSVIFSINPLLDDQPFLQEIYLYKERFRKMQLDMMNWHPPKHEENYLIYVGSDKDFDKMVSSLKEKGMVELINKLVDHNHLFHENDFVFKTRAERDQLYQALVAHIETDEIEISHHSFYYCDGGCEDIVEEIASNGWALSDDCEDMTFYTREELEEELKYEAPENIKWFDNSWMHFKIKIKRSCTKYGIDYPDWITLGPSYYDE